jgi:hypothetical protein
VLVRSGHAREPGELQAADAVFDDLADCAQALGDPIRGNPTA